MSFKKFSQIHSYNKINSEGNFFGKNLIRSQEKLLFFIKTNMIFFLFLKDLKGS